MGRPGPGDRLRVGFVGAGRIADLHVLGWLEHPRAEVGAVADPDPAVRARRSAEWGCRAFESLDDLLAADVVDAVEILTPHHLHAQQALAVLQAGKHLSLQKPPAVTLEEYDRVAACSACACSPPADGSGCRDGRYPTRPTPGAWTRSGAVAA